MKWRSAPLYGPYGLGRILRFFTYNILCCTVDDDEIDSMVNEALSVAKVDVTEKYVHTYCKHAAAANTGHSPPTVSD